MKKLLTLTLGAILACGMSACGPNYSKDVLSGDAENIGFHAAGGWKEDNWKCRDDNAMEATSVAAVAKLNKDVAAKLAKRGLKYLYQREIEVKDDAGWPAKFWDGEKAVEVDGKYTVKAIRAVHQQVEGETVYSDDLWITDPWKSHGENLSEDTLFIPPWQEEEDEHGFAWNMNPVITTQKEGKYIFVVAQYTVEAPTADTPNFGMAIIEAK